MRRGWVCAESVLVQTGLAFLASSTVDVFVLGASHGAAYCVIRSILDSSLIKALHARYTFFTQQLLSSRRPDSTTISKPSPSHSCGSRLTASCLHKTWLSPHHVSNSTACMSGTTFSWLKSSSTSSSSSLECTASTRSRLQHSVQGQHTSSRQRRTHVVGHRCLSAVQRAS